MEDNSQPPDDPPWFSGRPPLTKKDEEVLRLRLEVPSRARCIRTHAPHRLQEAFKQCDSNGDGFLDIGEISAVFQQLQPGVEHANRGIWQLMDQLDMNPPYGRVSKEDFVSFWMGRGGVDPSYGSTFSSETWQEALANATADVAQSEQAIIPSPSALNRRIPSHIRHHHYKGSTIIAADELPKCVTIQKKLGEGKYAPVYLVEMTSAKNDPKRLAAMKMFYKPNENPRSLRSAQLKEKVRTLSPHEIYGVIREANLMRRVGCHTNIVEMYDLIETHQALLMFMEPVTGGDLERLCHKRRAKKQGFSHNEVSKIMFQIFDALAYMHKANIVHRDLKPANIMLSKEEKLRVKLTDFGFSMHTVDNYRDLTEFAGTPLYAAPEVLGPPQSVLNTIARTPSMEKRAKKLAQGPSADLWSAGCIMCELFTGKPPFIAESLPQFKEVVYKFEGVLSALPDGSNGQRLSSGATRLLKLLTASAIPDAAQDLISLLLHPKPNACADCVNRVSAELKTSQASEDAIQEWADSMSFEDCKESGATNLNSESTVLCAGEHSRVSAAKAMKHEWFTLDGSRTKDNVGCACSCMVQ